GRHLGAIDVAGDQRVDDHLRDWRIGRGVLRGEARYKGELVQRYAIGATHPVVGLRLRECLDRDYVLHPIGTGPTGHHETSRMTIEVRQSRTVHLVGDERVFVERLPDWNAFDEVRRLFDNRAVGAVKRHLYGLLLQADRVENVLQASALPASA